MKIKIITFIILAITNSFCQAQQSNPYQIEKLGWVINLPNDFTNMNLEKKPVQIVEANNKQEIKKINPVTEKAEETRFQGRNHTNFLTFYKKDTSKTNLFKESEIKKQNNDLIESLKVTQPEARFNSKITVEKIDGVTFYKTVLEKDLGNNVSHNFIIYRTLINGYEASFTIFYIYPTPELDKLVKAFENSKFKK
ncbi:hypothetical protein [Chryseobacterium paludis]|uniref:hypothetical protein n=1 Tax=Chryseobacterium paludis TaxID=2956784 RepID=UPI0021C20AB8|nr:hypothetical protein [Chryseobacterium paludis]